MAGKGDIQRPDAWITGSSPIGVAGTITSSHPKGGITHDGGGTNSDPDFFAGSFTLEVVAPTLGTTSASAVVGKGDVQDTQGSSDSDPGFGTFGLIAWASEASSLGVGSLPAVKPRGPVQDPEAWATGVGSPLGVGTLPAVPARGDITNVEQQTQGTIGQVVWETGTPTLGVGTLTAPLGKGDIADPWAWQDAVFFLTSQPYPLVNVDRWEPVATVTSGFLGVAALFETEHWEPTLTVSAGFLNVVASYGSYTNGLAEKWEPTLTITGGQLLLVSGYVNYTNGAIEKWEGTLTITSGSLAVVAGYLSYTNWPTEKWEGTLTITGGTLA